MRMTEELKEKMKAYRKLTLELNELAGTKIFNGTMGAYAEVLTCAALDLELAKSSVQSGYDATKGNEYYQIKMRHKQENGNVQFEKLAMKLDGTMKIHYLVAIFMDEEHKVTEVYKIPANVVEKYAENDEEGKYKTLFWREPVCEAIQNDPTVENISALY